MTGGPQARGEPRGRRPAALALALALAVVAPFARVLVADRAFAGADIALFNLPQFATLAGHLRRGALPAWNPLAGAGAPLVGDPSAAAHHPGLLLTLVLAPLAALDAWVLLHLALAAVGAGALARARGASTLAAATAGAAYALGGMALSYCQVPSHLAGVAAAPWTALGLLRAAAPGAGAAAAGLAGVPLGLAALAGSLELGALALPVAAAVARAGGASWARVAGRAAVAGAVGAGLAACELAPFAAALPDLDRGRALPWEVASRWALHPLELLGLALPAPFAGVAPPGGDAVATRPWHPTLYVGPVVLALAAAGVGPTWRAPRGRALLLVAAALLLASLGPWGGPWGGLHRLAYELVPPLRGARYPAKAFAPVALVVALLAARGLDRVRRGGPPRALGAGLGVACAAAAGAVAVGAPGLAARAALPAAAVAGALLALRAARGAPRAARALAVLALLDLGASARLWGPPLAPRRLLEARPALVDAVVAAEARDGAPARVAALRAAWGVRLEAPGFTPGEVAAAQLAWREALFPNAGAPYGVRGAIGFSSVAPARVADLLAEAARRDLPAERLALLLGARLVTTAGAPASPDVVATAGPLQLARLAAAPPWAAVYAGQRRVDGPAAALRAVVDPAFDPRAGCVVEGGPAPGPPTTRGVVGRVRPLAAGWDALSLEVEAEAGGVLVVREGWGRGWRATVDGVAAPLLPADLLFRAVPVPPGRHRVELVYDAPGVALGRGLSLATLLGIGVALALGRRR